MTAYLEEPRAHYLHFPYQIPYMEDPRSCRSYHVTAQPSHPSHPPPLLPSAPPPPMLCQTNLYQPTPPAQYRPRHRHHEPPPAPHVSRPYNPYHLAPPPSPLSIDPSLSLFVGSLSKDRFVDLTTFMLDSAAELNNDFITLPTYTQPESVYFSVTRPEIPTKDYVRRLVNYTRCSPAAFVVMLIYIDRIASSNPCLLVTPFNMHRLLATALTLACKYLDDRCYSNVHYAKVGGIPTAGEMNRLELQYLKDVKYRLHVEKPKYEQKLAALMKMHLPGSPTSIMANTSPVSSATSAASFDLSPQRSPMRVERVLDFEGRYSMGKMVDDSSGVEVSFDPYTPKSAVTSGPRMHHRGAGRRITHEKRPQWKTSPPTHPSRAVPKRSARRDNMPASTLDPRFYLTAHPSGMQPRYMECSPLTT